ncbi:MAG: hypothetical protein EBU79_08435 [Betaproteobacteria bacterium]|nr:hypothetical protein [Betaproteobacteria bacterium]
MLLLRMATSDNLRMASLPQLPQVNMSEHGKVRYLHLGTDWVQGKAVEVAGYTIAPALAFSLAR